MHQLLQHRGRFSVAHSVSYSILGAPLLFCPTPIFHSSFDMILDSLFWHPQLAILLLYYYIYIYLAIFAKSGFQQWLSSYLRTTCSVATKFKVSHTNFVSEKKTRTYISWHSKPLLPNQCRMSEAEPPSTACTHGKFANRKEAWVSSAVPPPLVCSTLLVQHCCLWQHVLFVHGCPISLAGSERFWGVWSGPPCDRCSCLICHWIFQACINFESQTTFYCRFNELIGLICFIFISGCTHAPVQFWQAGANSWFHPCTYRKH